MNARLRALTPVAAALSLCAAALPVSIAGTNAALALLTAALLARPRADRGRIVDAWSAEPALLVLLLYAAAGLIAAALSSAPSASLNDVLKDLHHVWALALFTAALALETDVLLRPVFGVSFGAIALFAISQTLFGGAPGGMLVRAHGFVHPVVFGEQMAVAALGGACVLLRPTLRAFRRPAALFTALVFAALIASQTRMALFAALVGFMLVALLEPRARRWSAAALLAVLVVGVAWEFLPNGGRSISSLLKSFDPNDPHQARWALWEAALRMFRDHPLFGVGPGGYHRLFSTYHPGPLDGEGGWGSAHNLYLHQLAERGALGAFALAGLCWTLFERAMRAARNNDPTVS